MIFGKPTFDGTNDFSDFFVGGDVGIYKMNFVGLVGRIGLRIVGGSGLDEGEFEGIADFFDGVLAYGPRDEGVGNANDTFGGATGIGQGAGIVGSGDEVVEKFWVGGGEGFVDGLVGITDADPVVVFAGEETEHGFLEATGILRFVFENIDPAILKAF